MFVFTSEKHLYNNILPVYKYSKWKWKIAGDFNLNISFILFNLKYSGEACFLEKVVITYEVKSTIGKYCERRYPWSVFVSSSSIMLGFHTFELSESTIVIYFQLTNSFLRSFLYKYQYYKKFGTVEELSSVFPFSWNHVYFIGTHYYYSWNIIVAKMYKLIIDILKDPLKSKETLILFDGPDFQCSHFQMDTVINFTASSFQVSILYFSSYNNITIIFASSITKKTIENYNFYKITKNISLNTKDFLCAQKIDILCAIKIHVQKKYFVNMTLLSLKYSGPNIGYCKYGGLSIYDNVSNNLTEVLLVCDNMFPASILSSSKRVVVSSKQSLFLIFYSYWPYSKIELKMTVEPTICKGVHLLR